MHGYGIYRWPDGREYYGQRKQGKANGYGYFKSQNGIVDYSQWKNALRDGDGVQIENG